LTFPFIELPRHYRDYNRGFVKNPLLVAHKFRLAICLLLLYATSSILCVAWDKDDALVVVQYGKYGFIDHHGNFVIKPQLIWADDFWNGLGTVYVCGQYVSIDSSGSLLSRRIAIKCQGVILNDE
jgi:hypothetical protein